MRSRRIRYTLGLILVVIAQIVSFVTTTELSFVEQNKNLLLYPPQTYSIRRHQQFGNRERRTTNNISDDLIPTDLVLISSLDGSVRGVDRFKGTVYWTLQGGTSGSSVIRSTTHFRTNYDTRQQHADRSMHDESRAFDDYLMDEDEISGQNILVSDDDDAYAEGYEIYYIVEPQNGGTLYIYGEGRPLEKLPFSIQEIVAQSPIRTRRGTTYIGSKSTVMTAVDPRSGKILRKFDLDHSQDAYLMATQNRLPPHTIFLGRHDYKVAIFDNNNQKWWNLTYSEYVPNKLDWDVPESMVASDIYIAPDTTGAITAVKVANGDVLWSLDLHLPVVSVFDVYRRQDFTIALSKQEPPHTLQTGTMGELLSVARQQQGLLNGFVYVGVYEGSLFALSADHYPLVQLSGLAPMYRALPPGETSSPSSNFRFWWNRHADHLSTCKGCKGHVDFLVGRHPVISTDPIPRPETTPNMYPPRRLLPGEYPNRSAPNYTDIKEGFFYDGPGKFWKSYLAAILAICYASRRHLAKFYELYLSQRVKILKKKFDAAKKRRARRSVRISTDKSNAVTTTTTATANLGANEKHKPTVEKEKSDASTTVETTKVETTPVTPTTPAADIQPRRTKASGLEPRSLSEKKPKVLKLSDTILGYGSHGTIVYKGEFDGRAVAVKRLLIDFYDIAFQEVKLLQESDDHPNVVRYFYKEESDRFLYIALELCYGSLHDYMERSLPVPDMQLFDQMDPANILYQIMCGIQHLHSLKIVHRDIKPQNILLAPSKQGANKDKPPLRILLSDFGLCKKLEGEQSSFHYTTASPVGTVGWCAPELLANIAVSASEDNTSSSGSESRNNASGKQVGLPPRGSRAIDIFAAGCVFYYVLSGGDHPFGPRFVRENNILKGDYSLDKLQDMGEDGVEAADLISRMLSQEPKLRPNADVVLAHPFFWTPAKRLAFLQDASDRFEVEQRDPPSPLLQRLESDLDNVIGGNWYRRIDRVVANDLGKFRKYDGKRVRDLLRALRNKKHHWQDLPEQVKATLGEPPDNYLYYFTARFPHLFLHTYYIIADDPDLRAEGSLRQYF